MHPDRGEQVLIAGRIDVVIAKDWCGIDVGSGSRPTFILNIVCLYGYWCFVLTIAFSKLVLEIGVMKCVFMNWF